jgi:hypothetical protein
MPSTSRREAGNPPPGTSTNPPPSDFDPLSPETRPEDLEEYRLPPKPDPRRAPTAYANWQRAMASRPSYSDVSAIPATPHGQVARLSTSPNRLVTQSSSQNWSGGYVRSRDLPVDRMVLVQGRWIVPEIPFPKREEIFAVSVWVGLDGVDPASRLIPQIGTGQISGWIELPNERTAVPYSARVAWWQVWRKPKDKDEPGPPLWQVPTPVFVAENDRFYGQVQVLDDNKVSLFLKNETQNIAYAAYYDMSQTYTGTDLWPFERRTANWIVERPQIPLTPSGDAPLNAPLADYEETAFTDCNAATQTDDGTWKEFQLQRARLIRMNEWEDPTTGQRLALGSARPGRLTSMPRRVGDDALLMEYVE